MLDIRSMETRIVELEAEIATEKGRLEEGLQSIVLTLCRHKRYRAAKRGRQKQATAATTEAPRESRAALRAA